MRRRVVIDIAEIEKYYTVTENGMVWSKVRMRWLKPQQNNYGYLHYCLSFGVPKNTWLFAHTLVAYKYLGCPLSERYEIDHLDSCRANNHWTNLAWVTHSENVLRSYATGTRGNWTRKRDIPVSLGTRMKMANAKKKSIRFERDGEVIIFDSIEDAALGLGTYRKNIYRGFTNGRLTCGGYLSIALEEIVP
jgi:hypothetical protein